MRLGYLLGLKVTTRVLTGKERDRRFSVKWCNVKSWPSQALKKEEGARSQGTQQPLEAGKGKEMACPLEPPEGTSPADSETHCWLLTFKRVSFAQCQEGNMYLVEKREEWSWDWLREKITTFKGERFFHGSSSARFHASSSSSAFILEFLMSSFLFLFLAII